MAWWPLSRVRGGPPPAPPSTGSVEPAVAPGRAAADAAWRDLPALQRTLADPLRTVATADFQGSLASFTDPSFLAPLGHRVDPQAGGIVDGLADVRPGQPQVHAAGADLTVLSAPAAPTSRAPQVQRQVASWASAVPLTTVRWELPDAGSSAARPAAPAAPAIPAVQRELATTPTYAPRTPPPAALPLVELPVVTTPGAPRSEQSDPRDTGAEAVVDAPLSGFASAIAATQQDEAPPISAAAADTPAPVPFAAEPALPVIAAVSARAVQRSALEESEPATRPGWAGATAHRDPDPIDPSAQPAPDVAASGSQSGPASSTAPLLGAAALSGAPSASSSSAIAADPHSHDAEGAVHEEADVVDSGVPGSFALPVVSRRSADGADSPAPAVRSAVPKLGHPVDVVAPTGTVAARAPIAAAEPGGLPVVARSVDATGGAAPTFSSVRPRSARPVSAAPESTGLLGSAAPLLVQRAPLGQPFSATVEPVQRVQFLSPAAMAAPVVARSTPDPAAPVRSLGRAVAAAPADARTAAPAAGSTIGGSAAAARPPVSLSTTPAVALGAAPTPSPVLPVARVQRELDSSERAELTPTTTAVLADQDVTGAAEVLGDPSAPAVPTEPWSDAEPAVDASHPLPAAGAPVVQRRTEPGSASGPRPPGSASSAPSVAAPPVVLRQRATEAAASSAAGGVSFASMFGGSGAGATSWSSAAPEANDGYTSVQLDAADEPAAPPTPEPAASSPAAGAAPAAGPAAGASATDLDEMARRLYEPLTARIRAELWLDRERAGLMIDAR